MLTKENELSTLQVNVIEAIKAEPGITLRGLADKFGINHEHARQQTLALRAKGWLRAVPAHWDVLKDPKEAKVKAKAVDATPASA